MPSLNRPLRLVVTLVSAVAAAGAVVGVWTGLAHEPVIWSLAGFEGIILVAAVAGLGVGLGRLSDAPGLALACIGGTIIVAAALGRFSAVVTLSGGALEPKLALRRLATDPWLLLHAASGLALLGSAVVAVLGRDGRAWGRLGLGFLLGLPVVAAGLWIVVTRGAGLLASVQTGADVARLVAVCLAGLALAILAAVSVHLVIRAFEPAVEER